MAIQDSFSTAFRNIYKTIKMASDTNPNPTPLNWEEKDYAFYPLPLPLK